MITLLTGPNAYAVSERLAQIRKEFTAQYGPEGVEALSGVQIEPAQLPSLVSGTTLFATHRLVIINNLAQQKELAERFMQMLGAISDEVQVVLVESQIDKRTAFYKVLKKEPGVVLEEFAEPDEIALQRWAESFVKESGGSITSSTARYLVQQVGLDQLRLKQELEKLLAYTPGITSEAVDLLVEKTPQQTVFQLLEFAFSGRQTEALQLLAEMERSHEDPFQLINMLIWQTHIVALVASAGELGDSQVAKEAKINPFVVQKTRNLVRNLSPSSIKSIVALVAHADLQLKSSAADPWRILELTIMKFG